jgi:transcriptional regulator with XRE-family HTH domain
MVMEELLTWRVLLGRIISDPLERQRIANALNVNTITLSRWANNSSNPRLDKLGNLLDALPLVQREMMLPSIAEEFPEFSLDAIVADVVPQDIPAPCYAQVLSANADMPDSLHFWSICKLTLQQALEQLDPRRLGMVIMVTQCMPPPVGQSKIRSLRGNVRQGTLPLSNKLEQEAIFVGAESLSGSAVTSCHPRTIQNLADYPLLKRNMAVALGSATAYPILRRGHIGGCLVFTSTQLNYFTSARLNLIQQYANLIALAFAPEEFYDPKDIDLRVMPPAPVQKPYFLQFRQRVAEVMKQSSQNHRSMNSIQAERLVWQQLEEELLHLPPQLLEV